MNLKGQLSVVFGLFILTNILNAQPLRIFDYQGRLFMGDSPVADAQHSITFSLYVSPIGGTPLWSSTKQVTTNSGLFSVKLGDETSIPESVFRNYQTLYVSMNFNGQELTPRLQITSVAYAIRSAFADDIEDGAVTGDKIVAGAVAGVRVGNPSRDSK